MTKRFLQKLVVTAAMCMALPVLVPASTAHSARELAEQARQESLQPIQPGEPGVRPFWNRQARRFTYAPSFDFTNVVGATQYRFALEAGGKTSAFEAKKPWDSLAPVWNEIPEGHTELTVTGVDAKGNVLGVAGKRGFYRSPTFSGEVAPTPISYQEAGRLGLRALFEAGHVQNWLKTGKPDTNYWLYCYPAKVMGGLLRGMVAYSKSAEKDADRKAAQQIAQRVADHLIKISYPPGSHFESFPPTYCLDVSRPSGAAKSYFGQLMVAAACDTALGYLDLFDASGDKKYFDAAKAIAVTYAKTQGPDGTWPLKVELESGKSVSEQRLVPTWIIFLWDRIDRQYRDAGFRENRKRAWQFIAEHPLRTFQWDGQFEDVKPRPPYFNLAREQACDVAVILLKQANGDLVQIATAKQLLNFSEDQFVVWSPLKDRAGAVTARMDMRDSTKWMTPCVLEQYACYGPVARSSAVLIDAYLVAHKTTGEEIYLRKAQALASALVAGQRYQMDSQHGNGEVPTWLIKDPPKNWLNNSYYAAAALLQIAEASRGQ